MGSGALGQSLCPPSTLLSLHLSVLPARVPSVPLDISLLGSYDLISRTALFLEVGR